MKAISITRYIAIQALYGITILLSFVIWPLLYPFRKGITAGRLMPFWIFYDAEDGYASKEWLKEKGLKDNFYAHWRWSIRNPAWNFHLKIKPKNAFEINTDYFRPNKIDLRRVIGLPKGYLHKNGKEVDVWQMASIKTCNEYGDYTANFGEYFSYKHSTLGQSMVWYKIKNRLYFRYSKVWQKKDKWYELQIGTNDVRYLFKYKIMKLK